MLLLIHWFANYAMVLVAIEKIGELFFQPMGRIRGDITNGGSPGVVENNTKLKNVLDIQVDLVEAITEVKLQELNKSKGRISEDNLSHDAVEGMHKLYGVKISNG